MIKQKDALVEKQRIMYFDVLRIAATLGVILLHISSQNWSKTNVTSFQWQTFNFFDSIVRWTVPIFVMISGALFLNRDNSVKKIFKNNILRIITAFIFWSVLYAGVSFAQGTSIKKACLEVVQGHYHMWFLFMIVGLYLIVPFIKKIIESEALLKYFFALGLIFTFIIPQGIAILNLLNGTLGKAANSIVENINFHFTLGYIFYFILGYYLNKVDISKKMRMIIYSFSAVGFACTILGTSFVSIYNNAPEQTFYDYLTLNVLWESLGVFVFFKYNLNSINISEKMQNIVAKLSKYSFGAYLVHVMIIEQLKKLFGLNTLSFNPILSIVVILLIVSVISFAISWICNHIPFLNKYIV